MSEDIVKKILEYADKAGNHLSYEGSEVSYESTIDNFIKTLNSEDLFEKWENLVVPDEFMYEFFQDRDEIKRFLDIIFYRNSVSRINTTLSITVESAYDVILNPHNIPGLSQLIEGLDKKKITEYAKVFWGKVKEKHNLENDEPDDFSVGVFIFYKTGTQVINRDYVKEVKLDIFREYIEKKFDTDKEEILSNLYFDIEKEFKDNGKYMVSAIRSSEDDDLKKEIAISYYSSDDDSLLENVINSMEELFKNNTRDTTKPEVIITIPKEIIRQWGIKSGRFYENAPWDLFRLGPQHLISEGKTMKHCVGTYSEYAKAIIRKESEIWSLRSREGNRQFTFEIIGVWQSMDNAKREKSIKQIKGKGNRLPGYASKTEEEITLPDEVIFLYNLFGDMGVNLNKTGDINSQIYELGLSE